MVRFAVAYAISYFYKKYGSTSLDVQKRGIVVFIIIANVLTVYALSSQIIFYHNAQLAASSDAYSAQNRDTSLYNTGYDNSAARQNAARVYSENQISIQNSSNTYVSILWTIYAAVLTAIGFGLKLPAARRLGLALFLITAVKVVVDVWDLGQIYRIISFIVFGIIALGASFVYAKYKDRLKALV